MAAQDDTDPQAATGGAEAEAEEVTFVASASATVTSVSSGRRGGFEIPAELLAADDEPWVELRVGESVGRYLLVSPLGEGGMGVVYEGYDPELDRKVAVKVLRPSIDSVASTTTTVTAQAQMQLLAEAQSLAQLTHPNVVAIYDVGRVGGQVYLAMEMVEGITLHRWLRDGPHPWREVVRVFIEAGQGLAAAHRVGIVHHDFKPENVLLGVDGRPRVLDFGLAHNEGPTGTRTTTGGTIELSQSISGGATRRVAGTPSFMAPEQHLGIQTDERCDQYAFFVSLYEALFGLRPFAGENLDAIAQAKRNFELRKPELDRRVPRWLREMTLRGLSVEPELRHADMDAVVAHLRARLSPRRRRRAVSVLVATACLASLSLHAAEFVAQRSACEAHARGALVFWDGRGRAAAARAFERSGAEGFEMARQHAISAVDARFEEWSASALESCAVQRLSSRRFELHRECLKAKLSETKVLLDTWKELDAKAVDGAAGAVQSLSPIDECDDPEAWLRDASLPGDPRIRARALELESQLFEAHLEVSNGRVSDAVARAQRVLDTARSLKLPAMRASAHMLLARLAADSFQPVRARQHALDAMAIAESTGDDQLTARMANDSIWVRGYQLGEIDIAEELVAHAMAHLERVPHAKELRENMLQTSGGLFLAAGDLERAESAYRETVEMIENLGDPNDPSQSIKFSNLALTLDLLGRFDEAEDLLRRANELDIAILGSDHPSRLLVLANLGNVLRRTQRPTEALAVYDEALRIGARAGSDDALRLLLVMSARAMVLDDLARREESLQAWQDCFDVHRGASGHDDPQLLISGARVLTQLAQLGRVAEAESLAERLEPVIEGAAQSMRGRVMAVSGGEAMMELAIEQGRFEAAERWYARIREWARAPATRSTAPRAALEAGAMGRARLELRRGRCGAALQSLQPSAERAGAERSLHLLLLEAEAAAACAEWSPSRVRLETRLGLVEGEAAAQLQLVPLLRALIAITHLAERKFESPQQVENHRQTLRDALERLDPANFHARTLARMRRWL